jgi:hypothetical protein
MQDGSGNAVTSTTTGAKQSLDTIGIMRDGSTLTQLASVDANGAQKARIVDASGNVVTTTAVGSTRSMDHIGVIRDATTITQTAAVDSYGAMKHRISDASGNIITSTALAGGKQGLDVNATISASSVSFSIQDYTTPANKMVINADGSINVKTVQTAPASTIPVEIWHKVSVAGSSNDDRVFVIPNNTTLYLQWHSGGGIGSGNMSATQIWYDPTGAITASSYLHSNFYFNIGTTSESISGSYAGNGTKAIIARRSRLDATARELYVKWNGYLTYNTYTQNDSGTTTAMSATTITDGTKAWGVNSQTGRYVMVDGDKTPLRIVSNTATVLTVNFNPTLFTGLSYKIVTFNP